MIREVTKDDAATICEIYNYHVENTIVTFEETPINTATIRQRIAEITIAYPWLGFEEDNSLLGYAYANRLAVRSAYRFSAESTVYVARGFSGRGIGTCLYKELLTRLRQSDVHCVIGVIALPNAASVALHEKMGFVKVSHLREVGWKLGRWIDVGRWELILTDGEPAGAGED